MEFILNAAYKPRELSHRDLYISNFLDFREEGRCVFDQAHDVFTDELAGIPGLPIVYAQLKQHRIIPGTHDIFKDLRPRVLNLLRERKAFFCIDFVNEGDDPIFNNMFESFYLSCEQHGVDPDRVVYLTSDLNIQEKINNYAAAHDLKQIQVFGHDYFMFVAASTQTNYPNTVEEEIPRTVKDLSKHFSCLSRRNRNHRTLTAWMIDHDPYLLARGTISHDLLRGGDQQMLYDTLKDLDMEATTDEIFEWSTKMPLVADRTDFETNWAFNPFNYSQHAFNIANETIVERHTTNTLFYTEKSYLPMLGFTPMIINGAQYANTRLEEFGFKLYTEWFDYSFDLEPDWQQRLIKLLEETRRVSKLLDAMTPEERVAWKFQNTEILQHNRDTVRSALTKDNIHNKRLFQFLVDLDSKP